MYIYIYIYKIYDSDEGGDGAGDGGDHHYHIYVYIYDGGALHQPTNPLTYPPTPLPILQCLHFLQVLQFFSRLIKECQRFGC